MGTGAEEAEKRRPEGDTERKRVGGGREAWGKERQGLRKWGHHRHNSQLEQALRGKGLRPEKQPCPGLTQEWLSSNRPDPDGPGGLGLSVGSRGRTDPPGTGWVQGEHSHGGLDQLWLVPPQQKCQVQQAGHGGLADPVGTRRG